MRNEQIGQLLRKYRKLNQLSVQDVVLELSDRYDLQVAEKTVYGWESSQSNPPTPVFVALCDIYKINNLSDALTENNDNKGFMITPEEREIVERYRKNPALQLAIRTLLGMT